MRLPFLSPPSQPDLDFLKTREQFIPFRTPVLLDRMLADSRLNPEQCSQLKKLTELLYNRFHYEYRLILDEMKNDFVPFDPDSETLNEPEYSKEELETKRRGLLEKVKRLLRVSNFAELTPDELAQCLDLQPIVGLTVHVDTEDFDEFLVFYRGIRHKEEIEPFLFLWGRSRPVTQLNRVVVVARFKEEAGGQILIKMFKDVAVENLKIIAPKVKLGMPVFDRIKIGGTVFGSLITTLYKLFVAAALSWWLFAVVLFGLIVAMTKGIMSFLGSKTKYLHVFSSNLYYRSLSNNKTAMTALVDAAEEQEVKESLLAYFILFVNSDRDLTMERLDAETERWIEEQFEHRMDFEIDDAVQKLKAKAILVDKTVFTESGEEQVFKVFDLSSSLRRLDESWDKLDLFHNEGDPQNDRLAELSSWEEQNALRG